MTDLELMQMALDALEYLTTQTRPVYSAEKAIEALRARLDGWERVNMNDHKEGDLGIGTKPYAAQAAMVAQQTQGRVYVNPVTGDVGIGTVKWDASAPLVVHPHPAFQATQPQREWQGLTDEEMEEAMKYWSDPCRSAYGGAEAADDEYVDMIGTWRHIEAKLKEKNT